MNDKIMEQLNKFAERKMCRNEECREQKRHGSSYCQKCSDKHNGINASS